MALRKYQPSRDASPLKMPPLNFSNKVPDKAQYEELETDPGPPVQADVDIDLREVYFLIMHFLSTGPCHRTLGQFWNELLEHQLLPRRYHAWYSRSGVHNGDENDNGLSLPLNYTKLVERYPHIEKDHLVKLLKQLLLSSTHPLHGIASGNSPNASDVPTLLGSGSFSLLGDTNGEDRKISRPPSHLRWPHMQADQVRGLRLREIGGGFTKHHRAPSIRAACYAIAKPATMVQKMQNIKKLRGHRDAVYCAILDRSGRYVITGSDDRLVKIWSMETAFCLASCRGHEGDITDLAVSSNNAWVASSSNDCIIRVWRLPDGLPIAVLRGHTGAVTAIAFSPRLGTSSHLLSSSDDGTCRIWDIRHPSISPRVYIPRPPDAASAAGKSNGPTTSGVPQSHQVLCCAYNANGTVFVTGSSDTFARVWNACMFNTDNDDQPNHELDILSGHENDVNYVQFSGCAVVSRTSTKDTLNEDNVPKFKNSWFTHDNIVTCSRDGSAIIWVPKSRKSHSKYGRWSRAYHLKVPPPPVPPQAPRGGPRQRLLPTPRGVNMIVWSLDNRFVLAAIMDCRICVWNAVDGGLVHSLTGHSESTYVLDVHPFNPRIAMSAGYDGKTIVWDIWEGTPIRIYEIGRFKLVDGKFSPDGTSIILSDDVGQIYILNTGQGESQQDAKYDQFFLGDYRRLIQDTHGNVLDQETQLAPYWRNIQDLLCDSSMIPYPEPYQSMYQRRRLGALGIERRNSSLKFAVGPADIGGLQDFQMLPLPDLDRVIEPMPEFIDAMDWEPEVEIQSEDNDSEYYVTDEYSSEAERGSLGTSSGDPECSAEDSDVENSHKDGLRRSKRKKQKAQADEFMTSSGRRVKRRNLDECDGTLPLGTRTRKSRTGRKSSRKRSSTSKSLRPQRLAARNALNLFSQITGVSTDEDVDTPESEPSDSESLLQDSDIQSNESDRSMQKMQEKGREACLDGFKEDNIPTKPEESQRDARNKNKMVEKLSICDSKKPIPPEYIRAEVERGTDLVGSSSRTPQVTFEVNKNYISSKDPGCSSGGSLGAVMSENCYGSKIRTKDHFHKAESLLDLSSGYQNSKIKWGEVKARTSKRLKPESKCRTGPSHLETWNCRDKKDVKASKIQHLFGVGSSEALSGARRNEIVSLDNEQSSLLEQPPLDNHRWEKGETVLCNGNISKESMEQSGPREFAQYEESLEVIEKGSDITASALPFKNEHYCEELKEDSSHISTKSRPGLLKGQEDLGSSSYELKCLAVVEDRRSSGCDLELGSPLTVERKITSTAPKEDEGTSISVLDHGEWSELGTSEADKVSRLSISQDSNRSNKMYNAVYQRSKSLKTKRVSKNDGGDMEESTSNDSTDHLDPRNKFSEVITDAIRRTRSIGMKATTRERDEKFKLRDGCRLGETSRRSELSPTREPFLGEEWGFSSSSTVRLRSARNRRGSNYGNIPSSLNKRKSNGPMKNLPWLMLLEHEEHYRYIPQLGDEVVYLRQGHQEYTASHPSPTQGPWIRHKGLKAVEFCKVEGLDYSTFPGSGESCCRITLEFSDPSSCVFGQRFYLTLPELNDFADFLVERNRYADSIRKKWTKRDKCKVWWGDENDEGGSWWDGRIVSEQPKSSEFPDSPWERYTIQYKSDAGQHQHGPWELHECDAAPWEHPRIDDEIKNKLLSLLANLEKHGRRDQDPYGLQKLEQVTLKSDFVNRFPVSLSLDVIQSRLDHNYYRTLEAVKHDFTVMLSNAQRYFIKNADFTTKMTRLSEWFDRKLLPL